MRAGALLASFVGVVWLMGPATAQPDAPTRRGPDQPTQLHWAAALGLRVERVNRAFPLLDRVVLVPDGATFLDEVARWSPKGRWPVLIEDDHLAPMFIRRFAPGQVVRREPVAGLPKQRPQREARMTAAVVRAWGGDPQRDSIRDAFDRFGHVPPGVVIASANDPAWTAAVALAAGRGQPIGWVDGNFGRPNQTLKGERLAALQAGVNRAVAETRYMHTGLGDAIDAITLCRSVAGRISTGAGIGTSELRAVTDMLGRTPQGTRYAFTGWIFGDETRSAYAAMCSMFVERHRFWLYNAYPDSGAWGIYGVDEAAARLRARGFRPTTFKGDTARLRSWLSLLPGGVATDVLVMNSKGNANFFDLAEGRAYCGDVPVLNEPAALHLIHSFSMRSPDSLATIGGQWLARGVYAYVGSIQEPNLSAFLPPKALAERWTSGVPFIVGARRWDAEPWKINTFGDPLMLCRPTSPPAPKRVVPADDHGGLDLRQHAKALMRLAAEEPSTERFDEAIATLSLLGEDEIAIRMWRLAEQRGYSEAAAPALAPLFRAHEVDDFVKAMRASPYRDDLAVAMLWHLTMARLGSVNADTLLLLQSAVRPYQADVDLERLAPHLTAAFGEAHARNVIQREIEKTSDQRLQRRLRELLAKKR